LPQSSALVFLHLGHDAIYITWLTFNVSTRSIC